jgi:peptidoglycan/LPS O-acetylase OafA/YrhL
MSGDVSRERLFYLDHLRASLVILVVLHHLALVYGAFAPFYYQEPPFTDPLAFVLFGIFVLVNQSWFMGALFLLAGYFTPGSFDRKGARPFLTTKLVRLGIPILAALLLLEPVARLGFFLMPASLTGITTPPAWSMYPGLIGLGPLWFVAMLLILDFGYAGWRVLTPKQPASEASGSSFPGYAAIGLFILALAAASYLLRMVIPMGREITLFVKFLNFPTVSYLPQYLSLFILGAIAYRRGWIINLPGRAGLAGLLTALVALILLFPLAVSGNFFSLEFSPSTAFTGNGHWQSAIYALWDTTMAVGLSLGFIVLFRRFFNGDGRFGRFLAQHSYAVYIIHAPILVFLAYAIRDADLPALLKFGLAAVIVIPACFAAAWIIRKIPLASKVL